MLPLNSSQAGPWILASSPVLLQLLQRARRLLVRRGPHSSGAGSAPAPHLHFAWLLCCPGLLASSNYVIFSSYCGLKIFLPIATFHRVMHKVNHDLLYIGFVHQLFSQNRPKDAHFVEIVRQAAPLNLPLQKPQHTSKLQQTPDLRIVSSLLM